MRLIDADALEKAIYEWMPKDQETWMESDIPPIENLVVSIMMEIQRQPTIDPVKHGKWVKKYHGNYSCSVCGAWYTTTDDYGTITDDEMWYNYCPHCGARMVE